MGKLHFYFILLYIFKKLYKYYVLYNREKILLKKVIYDPNVSRIILRQICYAFPQNSSTGLYYLGFYDHPEKLKTYIYFENLLFPQEWGKLKC